MSHENHKAVVLAGLILLSLASCKTTVPYVNNTSNLRLRIAESEFHTITYVRAYEDDGELVLFGKVDHHHGDCAREPQIEVVITSARSGEPQIVNLPIRRGPSYQFGWHRASFRTRMLLPEQDSHVAVRVRDEMCATAGIDCEPRPSASVP